MGKGLIIGFVAMSLLLFSCKKEESFEVGQGSGGNNTETLLRRQVVTFGPDSVVITYTYDANSRLTGQNTAGEVLGSNAEGSISLQRNSDGIIQQVVANSDAESITYTVNYDAAASRYTSKVGVAADGSKDSVAYTYDGSGNVTVMEKFIDDGTTGGYLQYEKTEYTYGGDNVTKESYFWYDPGAGDYVKLQEADYEYDDKENPLSLTDEAFVLEQVNLASANNVTKETYTNFDDPTLDDEITYTYVYSADGRPASAQVTFASIGIPFPMTFSYQ